MMDNAHDGDVCELLPWDSEFWGFPVARVRGQSLTPERLVEIDRWCLERSIACLYFLATFDDPTTVRRAEDGQFHLADCRVTAAIATTLAGKPSPSDCSQGVVMRPFIDADMDALRCIASNGYRSSRFYFDRNFPRAKCSLLYERWIEESCRGLADQVLVAEMDGSPAGYISCHLPAGEAEGRFGLLNVAHQARRRGIGQGLIGHGLDWFARQQVEQVLGVTQARNIAIQAFNDRCGFVTRSFHLWYHKWYWLPDPETP